ncbi:MAG: AAA family ATPase, partial [Pseudomonadota bacterium]
MTRLLDPSLVIKRLVVKRNDGIAYDEAFHAGVNVIRGENSSGKSTVMNFLCYGLGGDLFEWDKLALLCTHAWLEVQINGHVATLRREVAESSQTPMDFFGGSYEDALQAPVE